MLARDDQPERAVLLAAAAHGVRQRLGAAQSPAEQARLEEWLGPLRTALGPAADALWAEGSAMALEEAIETALASCSAEPLRALG